MKKDKYIQNVLLSATDLSIIHQGVKLLINKQRKTIAEAEGLYLTTLESHLAYLQKLKTRFYKLTVKMENEVLRDLDKINKE
ncbi:MAG: hypothetical protein HYV40_03655 [Candidatus Levybacteria bacterium]|nr:hypothetical protein [Candidatus Levybacteria bacterium]